MGKRNIKYKDAIEEIEETLSNIENDNLDVDELGDKVKRVAYLIKTCKGKLTETEEEVSRILKEMGEY